MTRYAGWLVAGGLLAVLVLGIPLGTCSQTPGSATPPDSGADDPDFPRKPSPKPGDWLHRFKEQGQTVEEYKAECVVRKREGRETIVLQPMGGLLDTHRDILESVREYVGLYWSCPAEVAEAIPMPEETYDKKRRQYDADRILVDLRNRVPGKALAYFGFCREDLYSEGLNYVFGVASLRQRVGVYSLARYGEKDAKEGGEPVFLVRTLKVASHELAHMYGLEHCVRYACNVNGSNSVLEMDREPMHLCPECLEKARWNTGFDVKDRYGKLAAFYDKAGLKKDAAFARRQAAKLGR
jgi:archaemetzincin